MPRNQVRAKVKRHRDVRTFAELSQANWVLLDNAKHCRPGYFYEWMAAILMAAFTFEAYLNHAGKAIFPYWKEMERISHRSKLNIICTQLGIKRSDDKRPYQTLVELFRFRNDVVHGKSEFLDPPERTEVGEIEE